MKVGKKYIATPIITGIAIIVVLAVVGTVGALNGWFGGGASIPSDTMTRGLVVYYSFDEGSGTTTFDGSSNSNTGYFQSVASSPKWTSGKVSGALQFDGKDDYINVGSDSSLDTASAITVEAWIKVDSYSTLAGIVERYQSVVDGGWFFTLNPTGSYDKLYYKFIDVDGGINAGASTESIPLNTWTHVVWTYDGTPKLYIDGDGQTFTAINKNIKIYSKDLSAGKFSNNFLNGLIDEVRIYNRALTAEEIRYHYNRGGPVAHWTFDEGNGTTTYDMTDNNNDGYFGSTTTSPAWTAGKYGTALNFDGDDDSIIAGSDSSLNITDAITVETWVKYGIDAETYPVLLEKKYDGTYTLHAGKTGADIGKPWWRVWTSGGAAAVASTINTNDMQWHHIVGTYNKDIENNNLKLYIDGVFNNQATAVGAIATTTDSLSIGCSLLNGDYFNGLIDDVRVYNYARTPDEIALDYNAGFAARFGPQSSCDDDPGSCMDYGLVGYWNLEEGGGQTVNDGSNYNNHGTLGTSTSAGSDDPKWTTGIKPLSGGVSGGSALDFDNESDYVEIPDDASLETDTELTIEAWIRPDSLSDHWGIANKHKAADNDNTWTLRDAQDDLTKIWMWTGNIGTPTIKLYINGIEDASSSITQLQVGNWYHIVGTIEGGDGISVNDYPFGIGYMELSTGTVPDSPDHLFDGAIDEVRIYNRALSAEEIRYHYNRGGPVAHWKFDEGSGSVTYDSSGNDKDGAFLFPCGESVTFTYNGSSVTYGTVSSNDECWMDRNLGASQVATAYNDADAYGDLFQWGREDDGHQVRDPAPDIVEGDMSLTDQPGHDDFIKEQSSPYDWADNSWTTRWTVAASDPCPTGWRVPTKTEWFTEEATFDPANYTGAYASPLKLTAGGHRDRSDGSLSLVGTRGNYWSSVVSGTNAEGLYLTNSFSLMIAYDRADGLSVRCILDVATVTSPTSPTWTTGKHGSALDFDGIDDHVDSGSANIYDQTENWTWAFWMKPKSWSLADGEAPILDYADGSNRMYMHALDNDIRIYGVDNGAIFVNLDAGYNQISVNRWYFVTALKDSTKVKLYINGEFQNEVSVSMTDGWTNRFYIGSYLGASRDFNGLIDDVRIYNYARTASQIQQDYNEGFAAYFGPVGEGIPTKDCDNDPASCMDYGLAGYWNFEEGGGTTAYDQSDEENNGTLTDGPYYTRGINSLSGGVAGGSALEFDGVDDYVDCGNGASVQLTVGTVEAWIKTTKTDAYAGMVQKQFAYGLFHKGSVLAAYDWSGAGWNEGNTSIADGNWHHVVFIFDSGVANGSYFYVDGAHEKTFTYTISNQTVNLYIGQGTPTSERFLGLIDEVRIYNRALSAEEVRYHYNRSGPVAHWRFDEGDGQTAFDESANDNDGTLGSTTVADAGDPTWSQGKYGSALNFDGTDDYVSVPNDSTLDGMSGLTIESWIKINSYDQSIRTIVSDYDSESSDDGAYVLWLNTSDQLELYIISSSGWGTKDIINTIGPSAGAWHYVVGVYDGSNIKLYIDGVKKNSKATTITAIKTSAENLLIGAQQSSPRRFFNGHIDDVRIYNYARTPEQILQDYNAGLSTHFK